MSPRALGWALFLSLGANIFFLGAWVGRSMHGAPPHAAPPHAAPPHGFSDGRGAPGPRFGRHAEREGRGAVPTLALLRSLVEVMGGRDDPRVKAVILEEEWGSLQANRTFKEARDRVQEALVAAPFDARALDQAFSDVSAQGQLAQKRAQARVISLAQQLTSEERAELVRRFEDWKRRSKHHAVPRLPRESHSPPPVPNTPTAPSTHPAAPREDE